MQSMQNMQNQTYQTKHLHLPNLVNYDLPNHTKTFRNKPHQSLLVKITVKTWMISPLLILNWIPNQMLMHMFENMKSQTYQAKPAKPNLT